MLVEINLLPKKEPKGITFLAIVIFFLFILLVVGLLIFWQGTRFDDDVAKVKKQIETTQKQVEAEQAKAEQNQIGTDSITQLESAVKWASDEPLKSAPIIKRVVALLPERGFIQTISYAESGEMSMTVQFDSSREAAYFYKTLLDQNWITAATLTSLTASEVKVTKSDGTEVTDSEIIEQYVPRYSGQFQITLNRDIINSEELAEQSDNTLGRED